MFSDIFEDRKESQIDIGPNGMSIDLLRMVYRNPSIPLPVRIRCAVAALPHEVPRLQVTAQINEQSFAELLERRLRKLDAMNGKAQPQPIDQPQIEAPPQINAKHVTTNDKRFRRL